MSLFLSRSVEIRITNKTQNITLRNPRIYLRCGRCSAAPKPELSPGSSDTCCFPGSFPLWGVAGILVYKAESFTLAIRFSKAVDYNKFSLRLGPELSPGKAHLGRRAGTYAPMAKGSYSSSCSDTKFNFSSMVGKDHGTVRLSHGPIKVTATMSSDIDSRLRVVLEERKGLGKKARIGKPCRKRRHQGK